MTFSYKIISIGLMVLAVTLTGQGSAWAGGDHRYKGYRGDHGYQHRGHHYERKHHYKRGHHYKRNHHNNDDELLVGLLVGGLVGYAISNSQHAQVYDNNRYPPVSAPPQEPYSASSYRNEYRNNTCLQEREYQTTVIVGGKEVEAYGTACLQPDGSWRRGPAQLASY